MVCLQERESKWQDTDRLYRASICLGSREAYHEPDVPFYPL